MLNPGLTLSFKTFELGLDAQKVVALRMMRLRRRAAPGRKVEASRMVVEKAAAVTEFEQRLLQPPWPVIKIM